ncbi:MAG: sulfatase-like hydrolase/transferase [Betaproteobacteria bacterium]
MTARVPNFLLFVTDQQRADHLGCYGNAVLSTPNMDALAQQGLRFEQCHTATPICQPNRASLMTGRLPSAHGVTMNGRELSLGENTFVQMLRQAGWRTALVGKAHLQNITAAPPSWPPAAGRRPSDARGLYPGRYGQEVARSWAEDDSFELDLPYYGFEQVRLTIGHGDDQQGHWRRWLRKMSPNADQLIGPAHALPTPDLALGRLGQAWRTCLPEELHPTGWIADQSCELLEGYARSGERFFMQCSFPDPHHPFTPPGRYWDMYQPADVQLPASFGAALHDAPPAIAALREQRWLAPQFRPGYAAFAASEQELREALALNYGSIAFIDAAIGRVLATLDGLGLADNTVVLLTSDHGDLLGDRGLLFKGGLHYSSITRVPLIWRDTTEARQAQVRQDLAQTIDIAPTILARAGLAPANGMQGRSLLNPDAERAGLLIEEESQRADFGLDRRLRMRTWRTDRYRLTLYDGQSWGELYDLAADPLELRNLWSDPAARNLRGELSEQLLRAMLAASDDSPYPSASA